MLGRSLKHHVTSDSKLSNIRFEYEQSCDVKDLTADQFDISGSHRAEEARFLRQLGNGIVISRGNHD